MKAWKLFWDITAVLAGLYIGYKSFIFSGHTIPAFGYFPLGIIVGLIVFGITVPFIHLIEGLLATLIYRTTKLRLEEDLPFD